MVETKTIGVTTTYVSDYIFPSIIRGIEKTLSQNGYSLLLSSTNNSFLQEKECLEKMMQQNVQGLIIEPTKSNQYNPNLSLYARLKKQNIPMVMINAAYEELNLPKIVVDDQAGGYLATAYLIEKNHRNLMLITKMDDLQGKYRMQGFIRACEDHQLLFESDNIVTYTTETKDDSLARAVSTIISEGITGVVCYNDEIASELGQQLLSRGKKIPADVSLIGNDNSSLSEMGSTPFTTLEHPKEQLGIDAANWLLKSIQSGKELGDIVYEPQLIDRQSVRELKER